ncbi:MAG: sulfatase [Candidatus Omnitrophica bacterium]|nr:sulfatase [Candidatus Omnitrophota bacterium]
MKINKSYKIITILLFFLIIIILGLISRLQQSPSPNIILITVDALRPDHLGCYGYQRQTSPNIDKLAKEGVVFLNCFATGPDTIASLPGFFTGRYLEVETPKHLLTSDNLLDEKFTTLAEYLKTMGYHTAVFGNHPFLKINKGFGQGFDYYCMDQRIKDSEEITKRVLEFLNCYQGNKPLFIWIHYLDTHVPYIPSEECLKKFENDNLYKTNDKVLELRPKQVPSITYFDSLGYIPPAVFRKSKYNLNYYIARYDAAICHADFYIGELLKNIRDNTLIILSADHGESLGEHKVYFTHSESIYDEVLHIPLIIKDNRYFKKGKKVAGMVSSVDIVPTILNRINPVWHFFNKHRFNGVALEELVKNKEMKRKYLYSYYAHNVRLIRDIKRNIKYTIRKNGEQELYFLPDEYANRAKDDSLGVIQIKEELKRELKTWLKHYPLRADINPQKKVLDEETKELLRSLGYLQQ